MLDEGFTKHVAVARRQRDSAERRQGGSNVRRRHIAEILARPDAVTHEQNRDVLVIIIRSTVPRTCRPVRRDHDSKPLRDNRDSRKG